MIPKAKAAIHTFVCLMSYLFIFYKIDSLFIRLIIRKQRHRRAQPQVDVRRIVLPLGIAGVPFVAHIGGEPVGMGNLTVFGGDGRLPRGIFLTEACEYRRHLLALSPDVAVVTNMECDHPDCYPDIREVYSVFAKFVEKCPHTVIEAKNAFICTGAHTNICADVHNAKRECSGGDTVARDAESFVGAGHDVCTYGVSRILECSTRQTAVVCKDGRECVLSLRAAGSHLAVLLSDGTLRLMMLCILPVAAVIILTRWQAPDRDEGDQPLTGARALLAAAIGAGIGCYDGLFGPGTGTFAIIAFSTLMGYDMRRASGNAKLLNLASNYASLATYLASGLVVFHIAIPCAISGIAGNLIGSRLALKGGAKVIRPMMLVVLVLLLGQLTTEVL